MSPYFTADESKRQRQHDWRDFSEVTRIGDF